MLSLVSIRRFDVYTMPLAQPVMHGGRIMTPAGEIAQVVGVGNEAFRYLAVLEFAESAVGVPRGNHYHLVKHESLYIVRGELQGTCVDIATGEQMQASFAAGDLITIAPRCAHVFVAYAYALALEFSPTPYDPDDTYQYVLG